MCEDKAFKPTDRQKFKGWLKKWQQARIPLLSALLIELLAPAKILSLAFQDEEIDIVSSITRIDKAKKQLERLERRTFEELPTVKRLLDKVEFATGQYTYQNVQLHSFETAKDSAQTTKGILLKRMQIALETTLKVSENEHVIMAAQILNTEGWERNTEEGDEDESFADKILEDLSTHFREPLLKAGLSCGLSTLLEQWHSLIDHTKRYLNPTGTHYLRVWHRIFNSPRSVDWNMVLLIAELIFSIPISNAKVERLFSLMKRVKTDSRASLGENTLTNLVRIDMEGPTLEEYDPAAAMQLWASGRSRRPQQTKRKKYKKPKCVRKPKVLVNEDTTSEEEEEGVEQNDARKQWRRIHSDVDSAEYSDSLMRELAELE